MFQPKWQGGALAQTLTPPPPGGPKCSGGSDHIWPKPGSEGAENCCSGIRWGVNIGFTLRVYAQNAQNFMGDSNIRDNQELS